MVYPEALREAILKALPGAQVEVEDTTGTRDHFSATVVAPQFQGKSRIEQHKMVYAALGDLMAGAVHALALKTSVPPSV
jgi:stress-induced morphogen